MHANDLGMINLHRAANGTWSYTCYRNDFTVWITNRDMVNPGNALDEITEYMDRDETDPDHQVRTGTVTITPRARGPRKSRTR